MCLWVISQSASFEKVWMVWRWYNIPVAVKYIGFSIRQSWILWRWHGDGGAYRLWEVLKLLMFLENTSDSALRKCGWDCDGIPMMGGKIRHIQHSKSRWYEIGLAYPWSSFWFEKITSVTRLEMRRIQRSQCVDGMEMAYRGLGEPRRILQSEKSHWCGTRAAFR